MPLHAENNGSIGERRAECAKDQDGQNQQHLPHNVVDEALRRQTPYM